MAGMKHLAGSRGKHRTRPQIPCLHCTAARSMLEAVFDMVRTG
jgi:hypothetical protein